MSVRIGYLDCVGGVAGDMLLAALSAAGGDEARLSSLPARLGFSDVTIVWEQRRSHGFAARHVHVDFDEAAHPHHRNLADVLEILAAAELEADVRARAEAVFRRLAAAEAEVHGESIDSVHFHEVGAVDAIVDVVGVCELVSSLGLERVMASSLPLGHGTVQCAHGTMPLPAPAVLAMLDGVPVRDAGVEGETVTPTGLALLCELVDDFGSLPAMTVRKSGLGCGSKQWPDAPNIVRAIIGDAHATKTQSSAEALFQLDCNLDDLDPRVVPEVLSTLLGAGALDVHVTPVVMKKGRPGQLLSALCPAGARDAVVAALLRETPTLGVRWYPVERRILGRRQERVETPWGEVEVKVALDDDGVALRCTPEHDSCLAVAHAAGVPLMSVLATAQAAWLATGPSRPDAND